MDAPTPLPAAAARADDPVIRWLLEGDPAIRWQVRQDLLGEPPAEVAAERALVATEGAGARLLALQGEDGSWAGVAWNHGWDSTMHILTLLRELGLDPAGEPARRALERVRENVRWQGWDWDGSWREDCPGTPFFVGEVEPCINGQMASSGAYFGQDVRRVTERLLGEQLADGGWNCEAERGSKRSSFHTTICVLEALLEVERGDANPAIPPARRRGEEYLLERHLLRRRSNGEIIDSAWRQFSFPNWWHYDVLRGLEYFRRARHGSDGRLAEALALVESKRQPDGRWLLENQYPGTMSVVLDEGEGKPSRWNTLRALRVLRVLRAWQ